MNIARTVARGAGLVCVLLGCLGVAVGLALPWTLAGSHRPDGVTIAGIAFLGPLLSALCLAYGRTERRRWLPIAGVAGLAALVASLVAGGLAGMVEPSAGVGLGGPLTVAASALAVLGWVGVAVTGPGALPAGRPLLVAAGVVALLVTVAGLHISWYTQWRFVDATTAGAAGSGSGTWRISSAGEALVGVHGGEVLVRTGDGLRAYDSRTGRERWHYLRSDLPTVTAGVVDDAALTVFATADGVLVTAHEAGTGRERFSRRYTMEEPARVVSAGRLALLAGSGPGAGDLLALDSRTGDRRWTWVPERDGGRCDVTGVAATGDTVAVALRCRAKGVDDVVVGLSTVDGRQRWEWHTDRSQGSVPGSEPAVWTAGAGFLARYGTAPRQGVLLDAADGRPGTGYPTPGTLAVLGGDSVVYADNTASAAVLTAVEVRTGRQLWRTELPLLAVYRPVDGVVAGDTGYVLWRSADGALRVTGVETSTGRSTTDAVVQCDGTCPESTIAADGSVLVVATSERAPSPLTLTTSEAG